MDAFDAGLYKDTKGDFNSKDEELLIDLISSGTKPSMILDVGCGDGLLTKKIKEKFPAADIVAIDNSPAQIQLASEVAENGIEFVCASITDFSDKRDFDCIYSFYAFPHMSKSDLLAALQAVRSLLPAGSRFYLFTNISLFDTRSLPIEEQEACNIVFLDGFVSQINLVSLEEMKQLFADANLKVLSDKQLETGAKVKGYGEMISWLFVLE